MKLLIGYRSFLFSILSPWLTAQNSMEFVRVYDIANRKWYTQQTTGDIPRWRMAGCTVVVASDDLSSYSM